MNGGDLFTHLRQSQRFDEERSKFYGAQIALALEYLHHCDIIYRDLKLENVMVDWNGYLKLVDFGFCKILNGRTWSICGTVEYMAPEVFLSRGYGKSADWWSFGILMYEMNAGCSPFVGEGNLETFEKIAVGIFTCPRHFSKDLIDLVTNILHKDMTRRYGILKNGSWDIKNHNWFKSICFDDILHLRVAAPFVPSVDSNLDTRYFDDYSNDEPFEKSSRCWFEKDFQDF